MSKITMLAFSVVIAITAAACKKDESATGADAKKAMGLYAQGYNALLDEPSRLLKGYFSAIPGDTPDLTQKPWLNDPSSVTRKLKEARDSFAAATEAAPASLTLGAGADAAVKTAEAAIGIYEAAYKYYQAESYKDDKHAKAKELHTQMTAAAKSFNEAMSKLGQGMESIEDAQATDEIKKYAADKSYSYWFRYYSQQAKKVVIQIARADSAEELAKAAAAIKALAPHDDALAAFATSKGSKLSSSFKSYADIATTFQAQTKKLVRLIEAGKTLDDAEVGAAADSVIGAFNQLINMGNALYQVEAVDNLKDA